MGRADSDLSGSCVLGILVRLRFFQASRRKLADTRFWTVVADPVVDRIVRSPEFV